MVNGPLSRINPIRNRAKAAGQRLAVWAEQGLGETRLKWARWRSQRRQERQAGLKILKQGPAMRVVFFYPSEEGTYMDNVHVTLYTNGIVSLSSKYEQMTTHLRSCEILWTFETGEEGKDPPNLRILKVRPKGASSGETGTDIHVERDSSDSSKEKDH